MSCSGTIAPTSWIKNNMMGTYSEELGRPLTEAEMRVQKCLEQLSVPEWYRKHSRPTKFLQNRTPIESRPASWKTIKLKNGNSPRKSPWKRSPTTTPKKSKHVTETHITNAPTSQHRGNVTFSDTPTSTETYNSVPPKSASTNEAQSTKKPRNETYRITRKTSRKSYPLVQSSSESEAETPKPLRKYNTLRRASNTFPRVTPSRKIENINIVFPKPAAAKCSRTLYTITKNIEMTSELERSINEEENHASFLIAEIEPDGVKTKVHVFAGPDELEERIASPNTRFFNSSRKSTELERIVKSGLRDSGNLGRSLVQEMIGELDRTLIEGKNSQTGTILGDDAKSFVRSMVSALEQSDSDSELARSTSISFEDTSDESEEDVYWIPANTHRLPRTSSVLSMLSKCSSRRNQGRTSPGLSPIKTVKKDLDWGKPWGTTYVARKDKLPRQLFRIDETGIADSGYSDGSSSRTATLSSDGETRRSSPVSSSSSSLSSTPTFFDTLLPHFSHSGAYVYKSFLV